MTSAWRTTVRAPSLSGITAPDSRYSAHGDPVGPGLALLPCAGRLYALEQGLQLPQKSADTNTLLKALLSKLEVCLRQPCPVASRIYSPIAICLFPPAQGDKTFAGLVNAEDDALYVEVRPVASPRAPCGGVKCARLQLMRERLLLLAGLCSENI